MSYIRMKRRKGEKFRKKNKTKQTALNKAGVEFQHVTHGLCHALIDALSIDKWSHARFHRTASGLLYLVFVFFLRIVISNRHLSYKQQV